MTETRKIAERMVILAYHASHVVGMGFLQARDCASDLDILDGASISETPETIEVDTDYVLGRVVKAHFTLDKNTGGLLAANRCQPDYQSWCTRYPSYNDLWEAAAKEPTPMTIGNITITWARHKWYAKPREIRADYRYQRGYGIEHTTAMVNCIRRYRHSMPESEQSLSVAKRDVERAIGRSTT